MFVTPAPQRSGDRRQIFRSIDSFVRFRAKLFAAACRVALFAAPQPIWASVPAALTPLRRDWSLTTPRACLFMTPRRCFRPNLARAAPKKGKPPREQCSTAAT